MRTQCFEICTTPATARCIAAAAAVAAAGANFFS